MFYKSTCPRKRENYTPMKNTHYTEYVKSLYCNVSWTNEYLPTSCELHIASDYLRNSSLCLTDCSLEHIFHFVIGSCQQQKRERASITEYTLYLHVSTAKGECKIMRPELLNCQMQSHLSWLVVISNSSGKKALSKAFGARGHFYPFSPPKVSKTGLTQLPAKTTAMSSKVTLLQSTFVNLVYINKHLTGQKHKQHTTASGKLNVTKNLIINTKKYKLFEISMCKSSHAPLLTSLCIA